MTWNIVRCDWPLADPSLQGATFQTTSLGGEGQRYTITKDGRLRQHMSEELREYKGPRFSDDIELPIHGTLRLTLRSAPPGSRATLVVRFDHGQVVWAKPGDEVMRLHDRLWRACRELPGDYKSWGMVEREDPRAPGEWWSDCSMGCRHYFVLRDAGDEHVSYDWGVCTNPKSHRCGLLTFEHQGCREFEDEDHDQDEGDKAG